MVVEVQWNREGLRRTVAGWTRRQVPFVLRTALNATVLEAREEARESLRDEFTIRNNRTAKGLRVQLARRGEDEAAIGTIDQYLARQITGGTKTPRRHRRIGVPVRARRKKTQITTKRKWPAAFLARAGSYVAQGRNNVQLLYYLSRGRRRLAYLLVPRVRVEPSGYSLEEILAGVAKAEWRDNVKIAWKRALRTARR